MKKNKKEEEEEEFFEYIVYSLNYWTFLKFLSCEKFKSYPENFTRSGSFAVECRKLSDSLVSEAMAILGEFGLAPLIIHDVVWTTTDNVIVRYLLISVGDYNIPLNIILGRVKNAVILFDYGASDNKED